MILIDPTSHTSTAVPGAAGSDASGARRLYVLVQGLAESDIAKLVTFVRIARNHLVCDWQVVFEGEVHVLLFGGDEPSTILGMLESPVDTLRVVDGLAASQVPTASLLRPLQYESVIETLRGVERRLGAHAPAALRQPPSAATPAWLARGERYRLRRWPPAELVQRSRETMRIASYLATRYVSLDELSRLTNIDASQCERCLQMLFEQGVLQSLPAPAVEELARAAVPVPAPALAAAGTPGSGLFGRLRRTLGLS